MSEKAIIVHKQLTGKLFKPIVIVFLLSMFIIVLFLVALPNRINESADYITYYKPVALNILSGNGLITNKGNIALRYPPGYPMILALLFKFAQITGISQEITLNIFTILCMSMATVIIFLIANIIWSYKLGVLSAVCFITYPCILWITKQYNVELPFMVAFYGSVWLFIIVLHGNDCVLLTSFIVGVLVGTAMLIKPIAIGLPVVMSGIIWAFGHMTRCRRLFVIGLIFAGVLLIVAPWEIWIYVQTGKILPLSSGGVPSIVDGLTFAVNPMGYRHEIWVPEDVKEIMLYFQALRGKLTTIDSIILSIIDQTNEHPFAMLKFLFFKAIYSWYGTDSGRYENTIMLLQVPYIAVLLWSAKKTLFLNNFKKVTAILMWSVLFYMWLMTIIVLPILRYMTPAIGLLFVLLPAVFRETDS
jgi:4-amino-4-deoxy-L-arabinose transferase-like glycosyltransferase